MTLCLAWMRKGEISFASDSRLTDSNGQIATDIASKIFTINVTIYSEAKNIIRLNNRYGMCFTGSYLNGSIMADTMGELLSNLVMPDDQTIDAETIIKIGFEIYQDVSNHLMSIHGKNGLTTMWITGTCPKEKRNLIFKFSWQYSDDGQAILFTMEEALFDEQLIFIGDQAATEQAGQLKHKIDFSKGYFKDNYTEYHLLREIINNPEIPSVGGAMQTGHLLRGQFSTFGMVDYEIVAIPDTSLYIVKNIYTFRGIPLVRAIETINTLTINTRKLSMAPFTEVQQQLQAKVNNMNNPTK
jgi:hypothetical protein